MLGEPRYVLRQLRSFPCTVTKFPFAGNQLFGERGSNRRITGLQKPLNRASFFRMPGIFKLAACQVDLTTMRKQRTIQDRLEVINFQDNDSTHLERCSASAEWSDDCNRVARQSPRLCSRPF